MTIGTVKFFNTSKGFGFIAPEGGGKDVFVHATAVEAAGMRSLTEGPKVSFDVVPDARGAKAANSRPSKTVLKFLGMGRRETAGLFLWVSDTRPSPKLGAFAPLSHVHWTCSCALRTGCLPFDVVPDARGAKAANLKAV